MCLCQTLISFTFTDTNTNASLEPKLNKCTRSSMRFLQNSKISSIASLFDFSNLLSTPRLAKSDSFLDSWTWSDQQTEDWDFRKCAGRWQFFLQCDLLQNQGHTSSKNHDTETYYVEECLTALQCIAFVEIEMATADALVYTKVEATPTDLLTGVGVLLSLYMGASFLMEVLVVVPWCLVAIRKNAMWYNTLTQE